MTYGYEFDESGGYDCMTGAFRIYGPGKTTIVDVDLRHFGQSPCGEITPEVQARAEAVARKILFALDGGSNVGESPWIEVGLDDPRYLHGQFVQSRYLHISAKTYDGKVERYYFMLMPKFPPSPISPDCVQKLAAKLRDGDSRT